MRLTKRRHATRSLMDMTPMIDVVFLLLIFFMTVTQVSEANKERMELPQQQGSEEQKPTVLTVNVMQDGELRVAGNPISLAQLVTLVDQELARLGGNTRLLTVVLRADQRGTARMPNQVVQALGKLGIAKVRIAVEVPK